MNLCPVKWIFRISEASLYIYYIKTWSTVLIFLQAAKLDPYCGEVFRYLGDFYTQVQNDVVKAKKCYQKAFDLDPDDDLTGAALCDALSATDREVNILKYFLIVQVYLPGNVHGLPVM